MSGWAGSIAMLATLLLLAGAWHLRRRDRRRAVLMLVAGAVVAINLWLWSTMPATPVAGG